jgi:hypothetical protein
MSQPNQIEVRIPDADVEDIKAAIGTLRSKLLPHLKTLNAKERQKLPKMGDGTVAFVQKAYEYGQGHGKFVPAFLDMDAFSRDLSAIQDMNDFARGLSPICAALEDSLLLAGSEAYQGSLMFYQSVKNAMRAKDPDAKLIANDLAERFKLSKRKA